MTEEPRPDEPAKDTPPNVSEPVAAAPPEGETAQATEEEPQKLKQAVEITDVGPCKKHIKVTIERDEIDKLMNAKFSELVVDSNVAGFRPGKAPRKVVERRYHRDVSEQVRTELLLASMQQMADEHEIAPLTQPDIDPFKLELPKQGPFVYEFDVEVRPEFDVPNYKGLKLRRPVHTFTDEEVAEEERRVLAPYGQVIPKTEGNAQVGDLLVADITVRDGDRTLGEIKEHLVRVENQLAFKDGVADRFAEQVRGANPGDTRQVDITLSQNSADAGLRGKTVQAAFAIKDVKTLRLPELTHEFCHNFGVHSAEQLRELIRVSLDRRLEYMQRQSARQQIMEQIAATAQWQLPEDLLRRQARRALARRAVEMQSEGMSEEEVRGRLRLLQQDVLRSTEMALKEHFVLQKIAEVEKIGDNEEELQEMIDAEIDRMAERDNESPRRLRAQLEREDMLEALAVELVERKVLDLILQTAEYEDFPIGKQEQGAVATVEEQAVPGEMQDPTAPPPEAAAPVEGQPGPTSS
jgi:trigger factor